MSTDLFASFNEQYMNINTKLKKRFMRKPNISEATNEFIALAIQCEHSEQPTFAGHAYVGAAKCEATAGNALGEAEYYIAAARQFMKAEKKLLSLKFSSPERENLEAAIGCYMQALTKYPEKSFLRTSILMEVANHLVNLNHKSEAVAYYQQALENVDEKNMKIVHMRNLVNLLMECNKWEVALDTANSMISITGIPEDVLAEVQTSRVLLTLLVEPLEESKPESLKQLFYGILNDCETDSYSRTKSAIGRHVSTSYRDLPQGECETRRAHEESRFYTEFETCRPIADFVPFPINADLKLKLQSIILCHAAGDATTLVSVSAEAKQWLTMQQADLIDRLNVHMRNR